MIALGLNDIEQEIALKNKARIKQLVIVGVISNLADLKNKPICIIKSARNIPLNKNYKMMRIRNNIYQFELLEPIEIDHNVTIEKSDIFSDIYVFNIVIEEQ